MSPWKIILIAALAIILAGCGTTRINTQAMDAYGMAMQHQRAIAEQHAGGCATAASLCAHDANPGLCVVAAQLACNGGPRASDGAGRVRRNEPPQCRSRPAANGSAARPCAPQIGTDPAWLGLPVKSPGGASLHRLHG